jgi:hypothetical protein
MDKCENTGWPNTAAKEVYITDVDVIIKDKLVWQYYTANSNKCTDTVQ